MAITRLYPPILAGTIPSFYTTTLGTSLEVPFSMNSTVSQNAVRGIRLRLKTTSTDIILANLDSTTFTTSATDCSAKFVLDDSITNKLVVGNFYKIQIAYINDEDGNYGYYSTVAVVKYTDKPILAIAGLNVQGVSTISANNVVGTYFNTDSSEKVYQYRFQLMDNTSDVLEDTGWNIHNSQLDDSLTESSDNFTFNTSLNTGTIYKIQYHIITNNGLELSSSIYDVSQIFTQSSTLKVSLKSEVDNENGRVLLFVAPQAKEESVILTGTYVFSRRKKNSSLWDTLTTISLNQKATHKEPFVFTDYVIESGVSYQYSIQKVNSANIYSYRVSTQEEIIPAFEDIFLFDGTRQLRVRFNPTISSFKSVVSETKKTTLGRQYPFVLRNGIVNYKEFPINGLISYLMDNDELFISKEELDAEWDETKATTDLTDMNFFYERQFKLTVLDWLNNGEVKLFKSPQEGCYLVRLTNVSLLPNTTVSRMLHTFSCTATEIDEINISTLYKYDVAENMGETIYGESLLEIKLDDIISQIGKDQMYSYDLTGGKECRKIAYQSNGNNICYGITFSWGDYNFAIGSDGTYTIDLDDFMVAKLFLTSIPSNYSGSYGSLFLTVKDVTQIDNSSTIENIITQPLFGLSAYGLDEEMSECTWKDVDNNIHTDIFSRNVLEDWNNIKTQLENITYIEYKYVPVSHTDNRTLASHWKSFLAKQSETIFTSDNVYGDQILLEKNGKYFRRNLTQPDLTADDAFEEVEYGTSILFGNVKQDLGSLANENDYDFHRDFPKDNDGNYVLRVQSGVQVCLFGSGSASVYSFEKTDEQTIKASTAEDKAYEAYLKVLFNFIETSVYDANSLLYVYDNRQFIQIAYAQAPEYEKSGYKIYVPQITPFDKNIIKTNYKEWQVARNTLVTIINNALKKEG